MPVKHISAEDEDHELFYDLKREYEGQAKRDLSCSEFFHIVIGAFHKMASLRRKIAVRFRR